MLQAMKPKLTETDQRVEDALVEMGITYDTQYLGEREEVSDDGRPWKHDLWTITFVRREGEIFAKKVGELRQDYRTGIGQRAFPPGAVTPRPPYTPNTLAWHDWQATKRAVRPTAAAVLHSMFMDTLSVQATFEDWCDECGACSDSIKALCTYRSCQQLLIELRTFFARGQSERLASLVEDY
jgi:hypothetical protein